MMKLGEAVRQARETKGMSQGQLAAACGWSRSKQAHIEVGRRETPSETDRRKLSAAVGYDFVSDDDGATWRYDAVGGATT